LFGTDWTCLLVVHIYMNELEKAAIRVFTLIMIGLAVILWLQLQSCAPPLPKPQPDIIEYLEPDSTLAYGR